MLNFQSADFDALANLYNRFAPSKYALDSHLIKLHTIDAAPLFDWGASCLCDKAVVSIKKPANKLYRGPDQDTAHLSLLAYSDPQVAIDLMDNAKRILRDRGFQRLVFGMDNRHFFPGCPIDFNNLSDFLIVQGFEESGATHDLERDLAEYVNPAPRIQGDTYRLVTQEDHSALAAFFDREFPHRWKHDVFHKIEADGYDSVFGLFRGDRCHGFALLQREGCRLPIGGAVWRNALGPSWASLGPIGVSSDVRGQGSGNALLGAALEALRDSGARRCIIDWTGLTDFYGKHGFQVTRTYKSMSLSLDSDF